MTSRHFQKKSDRLIHPGASAAEIQCDMACAPLDRVALDMERVWGIDRLPMLVSPAMAAKFGLALSILNDRMAAGDVPGTAEAAENCRKGWLAMDAEARRAGHMPAPAEAWQVVVSGKPCVIVRDMTDWPKVAAVQPGVTIYSLQEVANALEHYGQLVVSAKAAFPGAEVTATRPRTQIEQDLDDEIPW